MAHLLVLSLLLNYFVLYIECEELGFCEAEKCANIQPLKEWFEKIIRQKISFHRIVVQVKVTCYVHTDG